MTKISTNSSRQNIHLIEIANKILRKITDEKSQIKLWCFLQIELKPFINILQNVNQINGKYEVFHERMKSLFDESSFKELELEKNIVSKINSLIKKYCFQKNRNIRENPFFFTMRSLIDCIEDNFVHYPEEFSLQCEDLKNEEGYNILSKPTTDPFYLAELKSFLQLHLELPNDIDIDLFMEEHNLLPTRLYYPHCINNFILIQSNIYSIIHHPNDFTDVFDLERFRIIILSIPFEKKKFEKVGFKICNKICKNSRFIKKCSCIPFIPLYDQKDALQGKIFLLKDTVSSRIEKMISKYIQKEVIPISSLIILPELSISENISQNLRDLIFDEFQLFIGGTYHKEYSDTNIRNICPINFNHGPFHYLKSLRARNLNYCDNGRLESADEGITENYLLHIFDSPLGRFSVLICSDFIGGGQLTAILESSCCDMIFIPSLTPHHTIERDFHPKSKVLARNRIMTVVASHGFSGESFFFVPIRLKNLEEVIGRKRIDSSDFNIVDNGNGFFIIQKDLNRDLIFPKWKDLFF